LFPTAVQRSEVPLVIYAFAAASQPDDVRAKRWVSDAPRPAPTNSEGANRPPGMPLT
jgi:hypothetical protein